MIYQIRHNAWQIVGIVMVAFAAFIFFSGSQSIEKQCNFQHNRYTANIHLWRTYATQQRIIAKNQPNKKICTSGVRIGRC